MVVDEAMLASCECVCLLDTFEISNGKQFEQFIQIVGPLERRCVLTAVIRIDTIKCGFDLSKKAANERNGKH